MAWLIKELLTEDAEGIRTEVEPTISDWAKAPTKPSYTAEEVGALPATTKIPSKTSDLSNDTGYSTTAEVDKYVAAHKSELDGAIGHIPVRGTDYWNAADIKEIRDYVTNDILGGSD